MDLRIIVTPTRKTDGPAHPSDAKATPSADIALLLSQARAGSRAAAESLVRVFADPVLRFLRSRLRSGIEAEDIAQNVFVKALHNLDRVTVEFEPWLWTIAWNELRSHCRKRALPTLADFPEPARLSAAPQLEIDEERTRLADCLDKLDSELKVVVELRFFGGLKLEEVAARQDVAVSTAHARCEKALRWLRVCMDSTELRTDG